jgi:hypothetical protein
LFGEYVDLVTNDPENSKELIYAKFGLIVPGLTREEVAGLSGKDGRALLDEVRRIWEGDEKPPLPPSNGGAPSSTDSSLESSTEQLPNA